MKKQLIVFLTAILLFSCKKENVKPVGNLEMKEEITLTFPDTVFINEGYDGKINYKNLLDTVTNSLEDIKRYRYIEYYFLTTKDKNYNIEHLKTIVKDTAFADDNRTIPLLYIKFNKLGLNYFDGIIADEVSIIDGGKLKNGKLGTRIIRDEIRLTRGVYVIERPAKKRNDTL